MAAFAVIVMMLMVGTTAVNAVSVKIIDENNTGLMQTLGTEKEIVKYGWTGKDRADTADDGWKRANTDDQYLPSPSGNGARCDKFWASGWHYIYYSFQLDEWAITDSISNVRIAVYFDADTNIGNGGPDLKVTDNNNGGQKNGDDYARIKQSMGSPSNIVWKEYTTDEAGTSLLNYVNSDGKIYICILNAGGCHTMVEKVRLRWTIDNYMPSCTISGPSTVERGVSATFTSNTDDPDGDDITEYKWKVDGTEVSTSEDLTYTFTSSGTYTVSLKVKDENGGWSDTATKTVTVNDNKNPTMESISPSSGKAKTDITFTFVAEDENGDDVQFKIEWGDGDEQTTGFKTNNDGEVTGTAVHKYMLEEDYTLRVKAIDKKGGESEWKTTTFTSPRNKPAASSTLLSFLELNSPALARLLYSFIYALL